MRMMIIVGRQDAVSRVSFNSATRKAAGTDYESVVGADVKSATRINCLAVVVRTLEQLHELDLGKETEPVTILTIGMVVDNINNGTFKYWLKNQGKKLDGSDVNASELELWGKFAELYKEMYLNVTFKDVKTATIPKNTKYQVSALQRLEAEYAEKAWERVKVIAPEVEELETDAI